MNERIEVWRDTYSAYEHMGSIRVDEDRPAFRYDPAYEGPALSYRLPVRQEAFSERDTELFFSSLVPEGQTRIDFLDALRADRREYAPLLERLNNESTGALVFSVGDAPSIADERYDPIDPSLFEQLAQLPRQTALEVMGKTRLSLAGAMAKIGLYRDASSGEWFYPQAAAPSTHIVKAADNERFPLEVVNEAVCLLTARACELPVEEFELVATEVGPLLCVKRFDRVIPGDSRIVSGHRRPLRLHQEDFCQIGGTKLKYEPAGGRFFAFATSLASKACSNGFGEAMVVAYYVMFDYLMGNCDNHLRNLSVLYGSDGAEREVAPLYDVIDTTLYGNLKDEMGVSLGRHRSIFGMTRHDMEATIEDAGMPVKMVMREYDVLCEEALKGLEAALATVAGWGYADEVDRLAEPMTAGMRNRARFAFDEDVRLTVV